MKSNPRPLIEIITRNPFLTVLFLSGLTGFCLGLSNATWQVAVETGQALSGIVRYPVDNPYYMYHIKAFSIINQISGLLLTLIGSEKLVSIIISGLLGMISFQALALLIFALNRDIAISILGSLFIYFGNYTGEELVYPIYLLGSEHTFGILGLSFIVLAVSLIGAGAYRAGLFCLGLAPSVHPSLGTWLLLVVCLSSLFNRRFAKKILYAHFIYFCAGFSVSVLSLLYQLYLMSDLPFMDPELRKQYLDAFVKHWDLHRRKLFWDYDTGKFRLIQPGILLCGYSIILGVLGSIHSRSKDSVSFLFTVILVAGISSLVLGGLTHVPPKDIPALFHILMPGRYMNFSNVTLAALVMGILTLPENKFYTLNLLIFIFLLTSVFFSAAVRDAGYAVVLPWFAYLTLKGYAGSQKPSFFREKRFSRSINALLSSVAKERIFSSRKSALSYYWVLLFTLAFFLLINVQNKDFVQRYLRRPADFKDYTSDMFYARISENSGLLLTTDFFLISLRTRRPILLDPSALDAFAMVPESGDVWNNALKKVYGIDLFKPPPTCYRHRGIVFPILYKKLWENRSLEEWQTIKKEFGVTNILTRKSFKLSLPVVMEDDHKILYEIPEQ